MITKLVLYWGWFFRAYSANLGGKPKDALPKTFASNRVTLFTMLLVGKVMWIGYKAFMTSQLSVIQLLYPFDSPETLLETDFKYLDRNLGLFQFIYETLLFRLGTARFGTAFSQIFLGAHQNTTFYKLMTERMTNDSFMHYSRGLSLISENNDHAYMWDRDSMYVVSNFQCHVSKIPIYKQRQNVLTVYFLLGHQCVVS